MKRTLAFLAVLLPACPAHAAEWVVEPGIEGRANTTDNLNLQPGVRESAYWLALSPAVAFSRNTETSQITGNARLTVNRYPDDPVLDTEDQYFYVSSKTALERHSLGLSATYNRDSTLQSELGTTGIPQIRKQRAQTGIQPSWQYSFDERSSVFANYAFEQVRYEQGTGLINYTNQQVTGGLQRLWTERVTATLATVYSRYQTDDGSQTTESAIVNGGVVYKAGERLDISLQAGWRHSVIDVVTPIDVCPFGAAVTCQILGVPLVRINANSHTSDDGWLLDGSVDYRWDRTAAGVSIGRDINPTGGGLLVQTDSLRGSLTHDFNERISGSLGASVLQSRYLGGTLGNKNNYYRLDGGVAWRLTENWRLNAGYYYAYQKAETATDEATANTFFVSLGYNWPRISISR